MLRRVTSWQQVPPIHPLWLWKLEINLNGVSSVKSVVSRNWPSSCGIFHFSKVTKKDLTPPFKRPKSSFVVFALERAKEMNATSKTPISYMNTIRESSAAWKKLSEAEKSVSILLFTWHWRQLSKLCYLLPQSHMVPHPKRSKSIKLLSTSGMRL